MPAGIPGRGERDEAAAGLGKPEHWGTVMGSSYLDRGPCALCCTELTSRLITLNPIT